MTKYYTLGYWREWTCSFAAVSWSLQRLQEKQIEYSRFVEFRDFFWPMLFWARVELSVFVFVFVYLIAFVSKFRDYSGRCCFCAQRILDRGKVLLTHDSLTLWLPNPGMLHGHRSPPDHHHRHHRHHYHHHLHHQRISPKPFRSSGISSEEVFMFFALYLTLDPNQNRALSHHHHQKTGYNNK